MTDVAVVIPALNAEKTLGRALASVMRQSVRPAEVIVVDDGCHDATLAIARTFADLPVRIVPNARRRGAAGARNAGVLAASSGLIAFLDADDEWMPGYLERQIEMVKTNAQMTFSATRGVVIDADGREGPVTNVGAPIVAGPQAWKALLARNFVSTPCVVARRSAVRSVGGFREDLPVGEDQDMWIRLALNGEVGFIDEVLVKVHASPAGLTARHRDIEANLVLEMILGHVARLAHRLSSKERREILRARYAKHGQLAVANGAYGTGVRLLLTSVWMGASPTCLVTTVKAAPPVRAILGRLRGRSRARATYGFPPDQAHG